METDSDLLNATLSYLQGGTDIDIRKTADKDPALLVRAIVYMMKQKYHRVNIMNAIIALMSCSEPIYRDAAYQIIQQIKLSHLLEITGQLKKNTENSKRLRHAIVNKLVHTDFGEIYYSYFIATNNFRKLFTKLFLPKNKINDKDITNRRYLTAVHLADLSIPKAMDKLIISKVKLVRDFEIPFEKVAPFLSSKQEGIELARSMNADTFFRHARWFKNLVGDDEFESLGKEKIASVKNPLSFFSNLDHLLQTESITQPMIDLLKERSEQMIEEYLKKYNVKKLALIVDISGSMQSAVTITKELYIAFENTIKFTDLIAFNTTAMAINRKELSSLGIGGSTSCGSSIVLLSQEIKRRNFQDLPDGILMVTDLDENAEPYLNKSLKLMYNIGNIPLIILRIGTHKLELDYPHAIIDITKFHPSMMMDIIKQIVKLTAMVTTDKETTQILEERKPVNEVISSIKIPLRDETTKVPGYLEKILTTEAVEEKIRKKGRTAPKKEAPINEKIKEIFIHTRRIPIVQFAKALGMSSDLVWMKIFDWAKKYNFVIDGSDIEIQKEEIEVISKNIGDSISLLTNGDETKVCHNCKFINPKHFTICENCGTSL